MKKQFAVIGMGKFGIAVGEELEKLGHQVLAVERSEELVNALASQFTYCVQADCTDENSVRALGLRNFDGVVVAVGEIETSIMITMHLKEQGVPFVCVKSHSDMHTKLLYKVGADRVVFPEKDMGTRVAHSISLSNLFEVVELSREYSIIEIGVLDRWAGKSLRELNLRKSQGINVVGIKTGDDLELTPSPETPLKTGQTLIVVGKDSDLEKLG